MSGTRRGWPYEPVGGPHGPPPAAPALEGPAAPPAPAPPPPDISRRAAVLLAIAGATALVLASLGVGDWVVRNTELRTLLDRVERAERAQLPYVESIRPLLVLCQLGAAGDEEVCDTVAIRQAAERFLPRLEQTGDEVADTRLTSFHGSLRTFRDRYVDHNLAWRSWLEALSEDPTTGAFDAPDSINTTFDEASRAADAALTPLPLHGNRSRVEAIFASVR